MPRSSSLPEKFLHEVWAQQLFHTGRLESHEGHPVHIIEPGRPNHDTGPDFLDAKIQIGGTLYAGDVEIHRTLEEWSAHLHQNDPRYNKVILHVVMHGVEKSPSASTESGRRIPTLILEQFLIEPVRAVWQKSIRSERTRRLDRIPCFGKNRDVKKELIEEWITTLGKRRIELKVRAMQRRLHELCSPDNYDLREPAARYGEIPFGGDPGDIPPPVRPPTNSDLRREEAWEQLLYESVAEALGYSKNQSPFRRLSSLLTFPRLKELDDAELEAALFGIGGFLTDTVADTYAIMLNEKFERTGLQGKLSVMERTEWQFFRLRPQNFPTLRLAGLAALIRRMKQTQFLEWMITLVNDYSLTTRSLVKELRGYFTVAADGYWKKHYSFGKKSVSPVVNLVGRARADEIIVNGVVPFMLLYARTYRNPEMKSCIEKIPEQLPAPESNRIIRKLETELIRNRLKNGNAIEYQGKIQLYKFYCRDERCMECDIGKAVF